MLRPTSGRRRESRARVGHPIWWRTWSRNMTTALLGWEQRLVATMLTKVTEVSGDRQIWGLWKYCSTKLATNVEYQLGTSSLPHTTMRNSSRTIQTRSQETITWLLLKHLRTQNIAQLKCSGLQTRLNNSPHWIAERSNIKHWAEPSHEWSNPIGYFPTKSRNRLNTDSNTT